MNIARNAAILIVALGLVACGDDADTSSRLVVKLTDAPGDFEKVPIKVMAVHAYHVGEQVSDPHKYQHATADGEQTHAGEAMQTKGGEWVKMMVKEQAQSQDLLKLQNGKTAELNDEDLPAGYYNRVRLMLAEAKVVVDGKEHDLEVPAEGIELKYCFRLKGGEGQEMVLDLDAHKSIKHKADGSGYAFEPAIEVKQFRHRTRTREGEGECKDEACKQNQAGEGDGSCKDEACKQSGEGDGEPKGEPSGEGDGSQGDGSCNDEACKQSGEGDGEPSGEPSGEPNGEPSGEGDGEPNGDPKN